MTLPTAAEIAARYGVSPALHPDDHLFRHHMEMDHGPATTLNTPNSEVRRAFVTELYFSDGANSAAQLAELVARHHAEAGRRRLRLLEFASGYGWVTRHLALREEFEVTASDIHPEANRFLRETLAVATLPSAVVPEDFPAGAYDVVFALSFFSHMPERTWARWLRVLCDRLDRGGLLIFTTCGRFSFDDLKHPPMGPSGFHFIPCSEQHDLPIEDYGSTVVTPLYVMERLAGCPVDPVAFESAYWWKAQDLWVARKVERVFVKDSSFSEEKEAKRLLFLWRGAVSAARRKGAKVFWFFFSKKNKLGLST